MCRRAGQVQQAGSGIRRLCEANTNLCLIDEHVDATGARVQDAVNITASGDGFNGSEGLGRVGNQLDVPDSVLTPPKRPDWFSPRDASRRPEIGEKWFSQRDGPPQRNAASRLPYLSECLLNGRSGGFVQDLLDASLFDRSDQIRKGRHTEFVVQRGELLDRDGTRFIEPTQVRGQISDDGLEEHPCAGLEHEAKPLENVGIHFSRWAFEKRPEIGIGTDLLGLNEGSGAQERPLFKSVAANAGQ